MRAWLSSIAVVWAAVATSQVQVQVTPSRGHSWRLPESILRETLVAADRGRLFLAARQEAQGGWRLDGGATTCLPAMAFAGVGGETVLRRAAGAAATAVERDLTRVLTAAETVELARGALVLAAAGSREELRNRVARRLAVVGNDALDAAGAAWALEARGSGAAQAQDFEWGVVVAKASGVATPGAVALAGLARLERGAAADGSAVRVHLRWLARHWPATAEATLWVARLADAVPPAVLHEAGFPLDWRQRVADGLITRQRRDPATGAGFWTADATASAVGDGALRETAFAVMVLAQIAE